MNSEEMTEHNVNNQGGAKRLQFNGFRVRVRVRFRVRVRVD